MPKVEITVAFAAVLRKRRATKGMSQELLAEKADIHPTHVGLIERTADSRKAVSLNAGWKER